jgi:hypothetical protein
MQQKLDINQEASQVDRKLKRNLKFEWYTS